MRVLSAVLLAVCALAFSGCSHGLAVADKKEAPPTTAPPETPRVAVAEIKEGPISKQVTVPGELKPYQSVDLHAKVAGYLRQITVDAGSRVTEGQLIATLEVPEFEADFAQHTADRSRLESELSKARAELERAESQLALARTVSGRLNGVAKAEPGLIARMEIDDALAREKTAQAQVASARAAIASVEHQIESARASERRTKTMAGYTKIVAPFTGIVIKRYADVGALIQAGTSSHTQAIPVVRLAQIGRLRLVATVPEAIVPLVKTGQPVEVRIPSLQRTIPAVISRASGSVDLETRSMEMEIDTPNPRQDLVPGMFAEAVLTARKEELRPMVPVQAVVSGGGNRWVFAVNRDNLVEQRPIQTGLETGAAMEILSGLNTGDRVVVGDRSLLKVGQKVDPKLTEVK